MDLVKEPVKKNPAQNANCFSSIFFLYTYRMFKMGYKKVLEPDDLYKPLDSHRSNLLGELLEKKWKKHLEYVKKHNKKPSLFKVLLLTFWKQLFSVGFRIALQDLFLKLISPILLGKMLLYFNENSDTTQEEALYYAIPLVVLNFICALNMNTCVFRGFMCGLQMKIGLCSLIYNKSLKLHSKVLAESSSGKIVNLLSNDVARCDYIGILLNSVWISPLSALIVMYLLWLEAGIAGIIGIIPVLLIVPFQIYNGKLSSKYRYQTAIRTDKRVRLMNEIINGIQIIKMYAWEKPFEKIIKLCRKDEVKILTKYSYLRAFYLTLLIITNRISLYCSILTMILSGKQITPSIVFIFLSYFNILTLSVGTMFTRAISEFSEFIVAVKRIQVFLLHDERIEDNISYNEEGTNDFAIIFNSVVAKWDSNKPEIVLQDISFQVKKGEVIGIVGAVAAGKSSLLNVILGELDVISGEIQINGSKSYSSQEPWIYASTIRQNIIFCEKFNKSRYDEVVRVCNLEQDFHQFEDGDLSVVGERGVSLSGGQKARVNLARAIYKEADIYLLDDPLSAVDVHVGKYLYQECINGFLKNKTVILVTHQVYHLKNVDCIYFIEEGKIQGHGTFDQLANSNEIYKNLFIMEKCEKEINIPTNEQNFFEINISHKTENVQEKSFQNKDIHEDTSKGKIEGSILLKYFGTSGNIYFTYFVIFLFLFSETIASGSDYFVAYWVQNENSNNNKNILTTDEYLYIYSGLIFALISAAIARSLLFYKICMIISQKLHDLMFKGVVNTEMRFFHINPSGRILNKFSKDTGTIDEQLPKAVCEATQILLKTLSCVVVITIINPLFLIPGAIICIIFFIMKHVYLKTAKNLKRLEGLLKSPVFSHLNASIQGLPTIRAFSAQEKLSLEFSKHQNFHTSAYSMFIAAGSAFGFYIEFLCAIFTGIIILSFIYYGKSSLGGEVGLAVSLAIALTGIVQWGMKQSAEVSNNLTSVERTLEYCNLKPEKQPDKSPNQSLDWPKQGKVIFNNVSMKYSEDLPIVLNNLNFVIKPSEKIGIVGRTGSGKTSLITALFKLSNFEGSIIIDDVNTSSVNLQLLRSKISIIPQDPVLFSGTLRQNLDPFNMYPENILQKALRDIEFKDADSLNILDSQVMDQGSNFSVGEKQLICLARAIIRNNKIIVMDEATANVDSQTDAVIQKTIREQFANCTILTIAHRLNTIMDSNKVIVMNNGVIEEFDHPYILLSSECSIFYNMVQSTGEVTSKQLRAIAKRCFYEEYGYPE